MKKRILMLLLVTTLLTLASPAMAYKIIVRIDGGAIQPNCTEMYVEFFVEENERFGARFWPQFDRDGRLTGVIANYWGTNYPLSNEAPVANFTVRDLQKPLKKIETKTCNGKTLHRDFGSSTSDQQIGIRKETIDKL